MTQDNRVIPLTFNELKTILNALNEVLNTADTDNRVRGILRAQDIAESAIQFSIMHNPLYINKTLDFIARRKIQNYNRLASLVVNF